MILGMIAARELEVLFALKTVVKALIIVSINFVLLLYNNIITLTIKTFCFK